MQNHFVLQVLFCLLICPAIQAQKPIICLDCPEPLLMNDVVERTLMQEKRVLAYPPIREADILWEKRIWRVIDTREKMNLAFRYPKMPLFTILVNGVKNGEITAYSTENDEFSKPMQAEEILREIYRRDTVFIIDPLSGRDTIQIVENEIDVDDIKRYRVKELWFFDTRLSSLRVRILGIAPLKEEYDDIGDFRYERPLFWVHYPHCREFLARHKVFDPWNESSRLTWENLFEIRYFSSYITKESNIHDRRLMDYLSGRDLLIESEKIRMEIFNFEQDLWSY